MTHVANLAEEVGLPSFACLGVKKEDLETIAAYSAQNGSNRSNPRPMTKEDYLTLLHSMMR